jgi:hypothetical protein
LNKGFASQNATGQIDGWEGEADWGKVRRPAIALKIKSTLTQE